MRPAFVVVFDYHRRRRRCSEHRTTAVRWARALGASARDAATFVGDRKKGGNFRVVIFESFGDARRHSHSYEGERAHVENKSDENAKRQTQFSARQ